MADSPVVTHLGPYASTASKEQEIKDASAAETDSDVSRPTQQSTNNHSPREQPARLAAGGEDRHQVGVSPNESDGISDDSGEEEEESNSRDDSPNWDALSEAASEAPSPEEIRAQKLRREEIRKGKAKEVTSSGPNSSHQPIPNASSPELDIGSWPTQLDPGVRLDSAVPQLALGEPTVPLSESEEGSFAQAPSPSTEFVPVVDKEEAPEAEGAAFIPWGRDPGRPIQKLPIRFRDCLGRTFLFPWEKARTWKGTKRLVNEALGHVDDIGAQVKAGHYDLIAWDVWDSEKTASINPKLASYAHTTSEPQQGEGSSSSSPAAEAPPPGFIASVENGSGSPTKDMRAQTRNAVVLPELWESVVEPGMLISMVLWPWKKKKQQVFNHGPSNSGWSSFNPSGQVQTVTVGTGRGRGAALPVPPPMGRGRGGLPPPPPPPGAAPQPPMPNPPPGPIPPGAGRGTWQAPLPPRGPPIIINARITVPKTRKKQEK